MARVVDCCCCCRVVERFATWDALETVVSRVLGAREVVVAYLGFNSGDYRIDRRGDKNKLEPYWKFRWKPCRRHITILYIRTDILMDFEETRTEGR